MPVASILWQMLQITRRVALTHYHSTDTWTGWAKEARPPGAKGICPRSGKVMTKLPIMLPMCFRTNAWQKLTKGLNGWLIFAIKPWPKISTGKHRLESIWKRTTQRATFTLLSEEIVRLARLHSDQTEEQVRLRKPLGCQPCLKYLSKINIQTRSYHYRA